MPVFSTSPGHSSINRFIISSIALLSLAWLAAGCQSGAARAPKAPGYTRLNIINKNQTLPDHQVKVNELLQRAYSQAGRPYRYGGNTPETGFDCSGFVRWVYNPLGVELPRHSRDMMKVGSPVPIDELKPGDLIFFNYRYSHVGIYTGHGTYIHSPRTGKRIQESPLFENGRGNKIAGARRIIDNQNASAPAPALKEAWLTQAEAAHSALPVVTKKSSSNSRQTSRSATANRSKTTVNSSAKPKAATQKVHKVNQGDTLYVLAQKHGLTTDELKKANNLNGKKSMIKPGQKLVIPAKSAKKSS